MRSFVYFIGVIILLEDDDHVRSRVCFIDAAFYTSTLSFAFHRILLVLLLCEELSSLLFFLLVLFCAFSFLSLILSACARAS